MKSIEQIEKMSLGDLEKVSLDETIPVPSGLASRASGLIRKQRQIRAGAIGIAASLAILLGVGIWQNTHNGLKDTFSDPYLAYVEIEKTLSKIGNAIENSAEVVESSQEMIDRRINKVLNNNR